MLSRLQTPGFTPAQLTSLDRYEIPGFDRPAVFNWNPDVALASDVAMYATFTLPAFMMLSRDARRDFLAVGFIYAEVAMLTVGLTELTKGIARRARPYAYNSDVELSIRTDRDARLSFFSGHTSVTAALCFATAKMFSDYSDDPTHEALVWTAAAIVPAATGVLRYEAGKHFPSDIIAGYFVGGAIGYLIPWLHGRKPLVEGMTLSPVSTQGGMGIYLSYRL